VDIGPLLGQQMRRVLATLLSATLIRHSSSLYSSSSIQSSVSFITMAKTTKRQSSMAATSKSSKSIGAPKLKHYTRPGVEAAAQLVSLQPISNHVDKWERASNQYDKMLKAKGGAKLVKLDKQINVIANTWTESTTNDAYLIKEQLLDNIIQWKFTIGKPRNALKPLLQSNTDKSVIDATKLAFKVADEIPINDTSDDYTQQITDAMNHICELSGVGPATASAVLCLYRPDIFAFMHDEVIECLYDQKRGYTLKIYLAVNDRCKEIANELNLASGNKNSTEWTPCRVGKTIWTMAAMSATGDEDCLSSIFNVNDKTLPACVSVEEEDCKPSSSKKTKKRKTNTRGGAIEERKRAFGKRG